MLLDEVYLKLADKEIALSIAEIGILIHCFSINVLEGVLLLAWY